MSRETKKKQIVCRSETELERVFFPESYERREREKGMGGPEAFGHILERELIRCIRRNVPPKRDRDERQQ